MVRIERSCRIFSHNWNTSFLYIQVADVALVAVPNAGKSTLLAKVTRAKPKIAGKITLYEVTGIVNRMHIGDAD